MEHALTRVENQREISAARLRSSRYFFHNGEFDSGSERTLAARFKHASRTGRSNTVSGARVSNTWIIYLRMGDNSWKHELIPRNTVGKPFLTVKAGDRKTWRLEMSPWPISLLAV